MSKLECPICIENVGKRIITCSKCQYITCKPCFQRYVLELNSVDPICMKCKFNLGFDFLEINTSSNFQKEYFTKCAKLTLEREKTLLPQTQEILVQIKIYDKKIQQLSTDIEIFRYARHKIIPKYKMERTLKNIRNHRVYITRLRDNMYEFKNDTNQVKQKQKTFFPCPKNDCKGFVIEKNKCGLCDTIICKKCKQIEHKDECNKDILSSVQIIAKETKNCPVCKTLIYKISGCDQMWCTQCHTPFSWDTGKIVTGNIHNPHFYQYQRENKILARAEGDIQCGGLITFQKFSSVLQNDLKILPADIEYSYFMSVLSAIYHYNDIERRKFTQNRDEIKKYKYRLSYLQNRLSEKEWLSNITKIEKARRKNRSVIMIIDMFVNTTNDILRRITPNTTETEIDDFIIELEYLRKYVNEQFKRIKSKYNNKIPLLKDYPNCWNSFCKKENCHDCLFLQGLDLRK